jgi:hypothetical protein
VTIIGLYSNVSGELDNTDARATAPRDWLTEELRTAPTDRCLLLAVHHPVYSLGGHGPTPRVGKAIDHAIGASGRVPDAVLSGHAHNYQRFTRTLDGRQVPYLVAGAGGMVGYDLSRVHKHRDPGEAVKLGHHNHQSPGFLRVTVRKDRLVGEYVTVPGPSRENDGEKRDDTFEADVGLVLPGQPVHPVPDRPEALRRRVARGLGGRVQWGPTAVITSPPTAATSASSG